MIKQEHTRIEGVFDKNEEYEAALKVFVNDVEVNTVYSEPASNQSNGEHV